MLRLSHIVAAEEIWFERVQTLGHEPLPLFKPQPRSLLTPRLEKSAQRWLDLVDQLVTFIKSYHIKPPKAPLIRHLWTIS